MRSILCSVKCKLVTITVIIRLYAKLKPTLIRFINLHQPVISMGIGSCSFATNLTWTGVWWRSRHAPEARGFGADRSALGDLGGFTTKIIHF